MNDSATYRELMEFIKAVEDGTIALETTWNPESGDWGNISYVASNGWKITVFNDANEWDYIDSFVTNDGRIFDFDQLDIMGITDYEPPLELARQRYHIPGRSRNA
jgi:hypothetical protein